MWHAMEKKGLSQRTYSGASWPRSPNTVIGSFIHKAIKDKLLVSIYVHFRGFYCPWISDFRYPMYMYIGNMINYFFCYKVIFKIPHGNKGIPNISNGTTIEKWAWKTLVIEMPKTAGRRFLKRENCHKTRPVFFQHLPDFLRYRGPSNILHNKYTNVLCLLGTRGRENVF